VSIAIPHASAPTLTTATAGSVAPMSFHFGAAGPPVLNFSGCSVNVYTGPVMTPQHLSKNMFGLSASDIENFANF